MENVIAPYQNVVVIEHSYFLAVRVGMLLAGERGGLSFYMGRGYGEQIHCIGVLLSLRGE